MPEQTHEQVITISMPTDTYFMSGIRDFTLTMVRNMTGMSDQWAYRLQSVVDELCNNAIEHGSASGESITVKFISKHGEKIEVIVEDTGTGSHPMTAAELIAHVEKAKEIVAQPTLNIGMRGRGLAQIVSSWTDELNFEDIDGGGIRVSVSKGINTEHESRETGFLRSHEQA